MLEPGTRKSIKSFFNLRIFRFHVQAEKLKKEKATLIETVMETETYKVAKEILEKFGMEHPASRTPMVRF